MAGTAPTIAHRAAPCRRAFLAALLGAGAVAAIGLAPATASAKVEAVFTEIVVPEGPESKALAKQVRALLASSAKRADFGKGTHKVRLRARITELELIEAGDVLKVRCTMVGRVEGGRGARSRLEYGGKPSQRTALRKKVLAMVADGLVTRLAQIARERR